MAAWRPPLSSERPANHLACGCCSGGCVCLGHCDIPRGLLPRVCAYHASLPLAPLDASFRWDPGLQDYVRVPVESK